jgi:hypothetical protein
MEKYEIKFEDDHEKMGYLIMFIAALIGVFSIIGIFVGFWLGTTDHMESITGILFMACFLMILGRIVEN